MLLVVVEWWLGGLDMVAGMNWLVDGGDDLVVLFYFSEGTVGGRPRELSFGLSILANRKDVLQVKVAC